MPKKRVLPKLRSDDHPGSGKELLGRLRAGSIGVNILLRERQRIQLLLLDEVGIVIRDEVKDDFVGLDAEALSYGLSFHLENMHINIHTSAIFETILFFASS